MRGRSSHPDEGQERGSGRRNRSFGEGGSREEGDEVLFNWVGMSSNKLI